MNHSAGNGAFHASKSPGLIDNIRDLSTTDRDDATQPSNIKRRKNLTRETSKTQGQEDSELRTFTNLFPADVLFEIFGLLMPGDILRLSQTSKQLHTFLTSRSCAFVWKTALANVKPPPPPCPSDLNLMQLVNLLYGAHCSFCGSEAQQVEFELRLRICDACTNKYFRLGQRSSVRPHRTTAQSLCGTFRKRSGRTSDIYVLKTDFDEALATLQSLATDHNAYANYVREKRVFRQERYEFAEACKTWKNTTNILRNQEIYAIRNARTDFIISKLKDLGWDHEIVYLQTKYGYSKVPGISLEQYLTDKEWVSLKPDVLTFFEGIRAEILENERNAVLWERYLALKKFIYGYAATHKKEFVIRPNAIDYLTMEPIRSLIFDAKLDQKFDEDDLDSLKPHLLALYTSINESQDVILAGLLPKLATPRGDTIEHKIARLNLATTFFSCRWCSQPVMYPRVLVHSCFYKHHTDSGLEESELPYNFRAHSDVAPWNLGGDRITFNKNVSGIAATIVTLHGEDPETATVAHIDALDARLECLRCRGRQVMKWRNAICHEMERHPKGDIDTRQMGWRKLDEKELLLAHAAEEKEGRIGKSLECDLCHAVIERARCRDHLMETHHLTDAKTLSTEDIEKRFSELLDQSMKQRPYVVKIR